MKRVSMLAVGEEVCCAAGYPSLTYFHPGRVAGPLVVFVPGAAHLGRIAYGHAGADPQDFMAAWLQEMGFPFAAVSYPMAHAVYGRKVFPFFTIRDWGRQAATVAADLIRRHRLSPRIVVVGWSMAGHVPATFTEAARELGLDVRVFISLCGTPPLPGQLPGLEEELVADTAGLAAYHPFLPFFERSVSEQNALNHHDAIPLHLYAREYLGAFSVNLWGSSIRYRRGRFVRDEGAAVEDMGSFRYHHFPLIATIVNEQPTDPMHALTDRHRWAFYQMNALYDSVFTHSPMARPNFSPAAWDELHALFDTLPRSLSRTISGNHWSFVGRIGARQAADNIASLIEAAEEVWRRLAHCAPGVGPDREVRA
jgi:hypothetical protein